MLGDVAIEGEYTMTVSLETDARGRKDFRQDEFMRIMRQR